jgi:hypothetical protein
MRWQKGSPVPGLQRWKVEKEAAGSMNSLFSTEERCFLSPQIDWIGSFFLLDLVSHWQRPAMEQCKQAYQIYDLY